MTTETKLDAGERARFIRSQLPAEGLFAEHHWRISPEPFVVDEALGSQIESLGRVLLQFYRAVNLLYRQSVAGKQPAWVAALLDQGKPAELVAVQRAASFKQDLPRVIRPDILLTEKGLSITELDSVPGGIGLTAWLNETYSKTGVTGGSSLIGGERGMMDGFASLFGEARRVHIVVSEEASTYRPEMAWLAERLGHERFAVRDAHFADIEPGDAVYRFFELFDLANVPASTRIFEMAARGQILLTPPPKPIFEEKLLFALLWNRNLREFWRRELGEGFFLRLLELVPYSWVIDPGPLPPHAAIPELNLTDWRQLKVLSQRERELVLKVSGFSELAWGARGVHLGSDLSAGDWSVAVEAALAEFHRSPRILQRYLKPRLVPASYYDFEKAELVPMSGRVRLCPYYFVTGIGDAARARLCGALATICPADKKIIHGMSDAILVPAATTPDASLSA